MSQQEVSKELIYDLTQLKGKYNDKVEQLIQLFVKNINHLKSQLSHLHHVNQCYSDTINRIAKKLDIQHQVVVPTASRQEFSAFQQDLRGVEQKLAALKNTTKQEVPQIIERIVEVGVPVEVIKEVQVEKVVEVPIIKEILVEKIVEVKVEKPVFIEKIIEVQKVVQKVIPIIKEVEVECSHRCNGIK